MSSHSGCLNCSHRDQQIEQLRQKLEHAVHMNKMLSQECKRLEESVKEAKWQRGRSGNWIPPNLPNELWIVIFNYATECKRPALSHLPGNQEDITWSESLLARRSIPLVCRQWAVAGREFLYTRLVFYHSRQLDHIMRTFKERLNYLEWVRDVELIQIQGEFHVDRDSYFYGTAHFLLESLPRLRSLVINPLYQTECPSIKMIVQAVQPKLQTLHLSSTVPGLWRSVFTTVPMNAGDVHVDNWKNLQTLCINDGHWWDPISYNDGIFRDFTQFRLPSLRTLSLHWSARPPDSVFSFLRRHPTLTEVYLNDGSASLAPYIDRFLNALPNLEVLSVHMRDMSRYMDTTMTDEGLIHGSLEMFIIRNIYWFDRTSLTSLKPVIQKLRLGELPACKVIKMQGDFFDGCVDANIFIGEPTLLDWRDAIRVCKECNVSLVNEAGQELFLWTDRHRNFTSNWRIHETELDVSDEHSASASDSDEESWTEDEGEMTDTALWVETDEELDEWSDTPYVYKRRVDLRPVEDDDSDLE